MTGRRVLFLAALYVRLIARRVASHLRPPLGEHAAVWRANARAAAVRRWRRIRRAVVHTGRHRAGLPRHAAPKGATTC